MATKTTTELASAVLQRLNVIGPDQAANADDAAFVTSTYSAKFEELEDEELAYWTETAIPEKVFRPLVNIMAGECAVEFHAGAPKLVEMYVLLGERGMMKLRAIVSKPDEDEPVRADYF